MDTQSTQIGMSKGSSPNPNLGTRNAEMWEFEEWNLKNNSYQGNPFDLDAKVTFTHTQTGEQRTTGLFYDGGNEWIFRFTGDLKGEWRFETESADQDLDGFTGKVNVRINDNPDVDGFLTSVGNKFAIQTADANTTEGYLLNVYMNQKEHFKQGEFDRWKPSKTQAYLADARQNGSEVLYFQVNNNWFDFGSETDREHNSRNPDEKTFELLETIITDVHQQGGRVHFWAWGDRDRGWIAKDGVNSEADQRLQSYIAARLGPLPGWSMGYSFDTQEFTDDSQMEFWANNLQDQMGWDHLLFARGYAASANVPVNNPTSNNDWVATNLSGHSYSSKGKQQVGLQTAPISPRSIEEVIQDINTDNRKPHFYEERFTYNRANVGSTQGPPIDMDQTRQLLWWQAMAGGVGGWYGFFDKGGQFAPDYSNPEQLRTHYTFWHDNDRFTLDLQQANNLADSADTHLLKRTDGSRYIVYAEGRDDVQIDLPKLANGNRVIAVDTKKNYREIGLGSLTQGNNRKIDLPYRSDWAIVIEESGRSKPGPQPPPNSPTDKAAPTAKLDAPDITAAGGQFQTIEVDYQDNRALNIASIDNNDIAVTDKNGKRLQTVLSDIGPTSNGKSLTATYRVSAPGDRWDASDNGQYTVRLQNNQVKDAAGNAAQGKTLGRFDVNIKTDTPNPPPGNGGSSEGDPILWWTLDDGRGGTAQDSTQNNRDGKLQGGPAWILNGKDRGALRLSGNNQGVVDADAEQYLNGLDAVTISMWVKSDQVGTDRGFLSSVKFPTNGQQPNDRNLGIRYDDFGSSGGGDDVIKVGLRTTQGVVEYESAAKVQTKEWQHVVLSWQSGQAPKLYIDGQLDKPTAAAPAIGGKLKGVTDLLIGMGQRVPETWDGNIDDVRIYDRALKAAEVSDIYQETDNVPTFPIPPEPPKNQAPTARADSYALDAGKTLVVNAQKGVLANDRDGNGDRLTVTTADTRSAQGGTVKVNQNGSFRYTPVNDFDGTDSFSYTVSDGKGGKSTAKVIVKVAETSVPTPPTSGDNALLRWTFNEGKGNTAQDATPNNRDGKLQGGAAWTANGQIDGALILSGKNQFVIDSDAEKYLNGLDEITLSMWVKSDQVGTDRGFLSGVATTGTDQNLGIRYDDFGSLGGGNDVIKVGLKTTKGVARYESAANVQTDDWQHIVLSWRSGQAPKLYIDGQLDKPTYAVSAVGGTLTGITDLIVGKGQKTSAAWDGRIDDVRLYSEALNGNDVANLYGDSSVPTPKPPISPPPSDKPSSKDDAVLQWTFDEGQGNTVQDSSNNNRDGNLPKGGNWISNGKVNGALSLNGKNQWVVDADAEKYLNGSDAITISMWVKSDQVGTDRGFLSGVKQSRNGQQPNDRNLGIRYDDYGNAGRGDDVIKVGLRTTQGSVEYESAANVQTTDWQHIVLSWQSGQALDLYIDGQLDKPTAAAPAIGGKLTGITDLIVGHGQRVPQSWDGAIDDVRMYDRALSRSEVAGLYADMPTAVAQSAKSGPTAENDLLVNYASANDILIDGNFQSGVEKFSLLESSFNETVDETVLTTIGSHSNSNSENSPFGDSLTAITGLSPLETTLIPSEVSNNP